MSWLRRSALATRDPLPEEEVEVLSCKSEIFLDPEAKFCYLLGTIAMHLSYLKTSRPDYGR
jgi:hypothetical protein